MLKPSGKAANAASIAHLVLGQLARGVTYRNIATFIRLYKTFVLPHTTRVTRKYLKESKRG